MANMFDYLDWRGDLSFQIDRFNEVDNLILSKLAYAAFEGILYSEESSLDQKGLPKSITIKDAAEKYFSIHVENEVSLQPTEIAGGETLVKLSKYKRFSDIILSDYVSEFDSTVEKQFSAITVDILTDAIYVAFRGTDDTIIGWKEDFNMGTSEHVVSQVEALEYFEKIADKYPKKKILIGGHSKGGNLAVYAAIMCRDDIKKRIVRVYNNDGPGFRKEMLERENYKKILPKIRTIVPESSIVGMLLEHREDYTVVSSSANGSMQHEPLTWEVLGKHFVYLEKTSIVSQTLDDMISNWFDNSDEKTLKYAVDTIFSLIESVGLETVSDFKDEPLKNAFAVLKEMNHLDNESKKIIKETVSAFFKAGNMAVRKVIPNPFEVDEE